MSNKGREALVGATAKTRERAKMVGMITTPLAILFFILGAVFGGGDEAADATPANTDTVEAAATEKPADKPAAKPAAKPADKPAAKPASKPAEPAPTAASGGGEAPAAEAPAGGGSKAGGFKAKRR